jgi:hypothetical protein
MSFADWSWAMVLELDGGRSQELQDALLQALDWPQLERLLYNKLDKDLEQIAHREDGFEHAVFMVVRRARQDGTTSKSV